MTWLAKVSNALAALALVAFFLNFHGESSSSSPDVDAKERGVLLVTTAEKEDVAGQFVTPRSRKLRAKGKSLKCTPIGGKSKGKGSSKSNSASAPVRTDMNLAFVLKLG